MFDHLAAVASRANGRERPDAIAQTWTEPRVALLKALWADGLSAGQIAAELGGITRSAVLGKVHRLGLEGRARVARPPRPKAQRPRVQRMVSVIRDRGRRLMEIVAPLPLPASDDAQIPIAQRVSLLQLDGTTCRWPVGDPGTAEFFFCGAAPAEACVYCAAHARRAGAGYSRRAA
jgi:GcrA cell cycle regulator